MLFCSALIGYGYWGPNIARAVTKLPNVHLKYICDFDKSKLQKAKSDYPQVETSDDLEAIFNNPSIDAVIIATPASTHFDLAIQALKKGKHILVEKPLTVSVEEAKKLQQAVGNKNQILMVGHTFEYNPAVIKVKKIIADPSFGKTYYIYSTRVNLGQIRGDVNALWNLAPHDISILNFLTGSMPTEVLAIGSVFLQSNIEDVVFAYLKYPNNIMAQIHVSWLDPAKERSMTVVGSKKMLVFNDMDNEMPIRIYDKRVDTGNVAKGLHGEYKIKLISGDIYAPQIENKEPLLEEIKHFFDCIEKNNKPLTDLTSGMNVVKVLEGCQTSLKENSRWVKII